MLQQKLHYALETNKIMIPKGEDGFYNNSKTVLEHVRCLSSGVNSDDYAIICRKDNSKE
jgi:hypothetical protein